MLYRHSPFILASLVLFLIYYLYSSSSSNNNSIELAQPSSQLSQEEHQEQQERPVQRPRRPPTGPDGKRLKTVLYWNEFYGRYDTYDFGYGHEAFKEKESCRIK